jgi:hypothetical protein
MTTLIEISLDMTMLDQELEDLIDSPDAQDEAIAKYLDNLAKATTLRDQKLDNYAGLIRELEIRADARKAEAKRLSDRAAVDQSKADRLKRSLQNFFGAHELKTVETNRFRLTLANNGGKLPVIFDSRPVEELPEQFTKTKTVTSADNEAIRKALDGGEKLGFAWFGERTQSLRIK